MAIGAGALLAAIALGVPAQAQTRYVLERSWGPQGGGFPGGIATDDAGNAYVTDPSNDRVQKFTSTGDFIREWHSVETGTNGTRGPATVATDASGNVYVGHQSRIHKYTSSGTFISALGSLGDGDGQFILISDLATDRAGNLDVSDGGSWPNVGGFVQKFSPAGTFLARFRWPEVEGQSAAGVAADAFGHVYVASGGTILKFSSHGELIADRPMEGVCRLGIAVDPSGVLYATRAR